VAFNKFVHDQSLQLFLSNSQYLVPAMLG
jgi:hypothetical protein